MLVLSRRKGETVVFPHLGIEIRVLRTNGKQVQLGVDAPRNVTVLRGELEEFSEPNSTRAKASVDEAAGLEAAQRGVAHLAQ